MRSENFWLVEIRKELHEKDLRIGPCNGLLPALWKAYKEMKNEQNQN